jgi:putative endonuclease
MLKCSDETIYTGITTDLHRRLKEHNGSLRGAKYTRTRRPVDLMYAQEYKDKSSASKREYEIKKLTRSQKIFIAENENFIISL